MNILSHIGFILEINNAIHEDNTKIALLYAYMNTTMSWNERKDRIYFVGQVKY